MAGEEQESRVLPWLDSKCSDPRFPRLAGEWALGCGPLGDVERAWNLRTQERVELAGVGAAPGVAPGVIWQAGRLGGLWVLPASKPVRPRGWVDLDLVAPPATDGVRVVLPTADELQVLTLEDGRRMHVSARPAPWYFPVVFGEVVAWVDRASPDGQGEDVWWLGPETGPSGAPLAAGPGNERHVALSRSSVAWIDERGVVVQSLDDGARTRWDGDAHTSTGLSLWEDVACWEVYEKGDVDVMCSDGVRVGGYGHQRSPSRYENLLLYRQEGRTWFVVLEPPDRSQGLDAD